MIAARCLSNLLEVVFKYLDADSLRNAELTCKAWKVAASDSNPKKLWRVLLQKQVRYTFLVLVKLILLKFISYTCCFQMSTSPLWERLNYCLRSELPQQSNDCWSSCKLFSKIEFTTKVILNNKLIILI